MELYNIAKIFFGKGKVKDFANLTDENKYSQVCSTYDEKS
jgi:hypothetical protein